MTFHDRVFAALGQFNGRLFAFVELVRSRPADPPRLPQKALDELLAITGRARTASDAIARSFTLIEQTSLDIVDMQVRLQGEAARLASALRELGDAVEGRQVVGEVFADPLVALDEAAQLVAAAMFPSAVQGLREVNVKLWDFEKLQWKRYTDILTAVVQSGKISSSEQVQIQAIADEVARAFAEVNTLLNDLAERRIADAGSLRRRLDQAPEKLTAALEKAESQLTPAFSVFAPVIKASGKVAQDVAKLLRKLTIPLFPAYEKLEACRDLIDRMLYDSLNGVQVFALLNILARLQATTAAGRPLLAERAAKVTHVFPDRIYFEVDASLLDDLRADTRSFVGAPASLHRFKDGSFKQRIFPRGNLQVTFAARPAGRIVVDADIDLYRAAVPHLFGEVLVNHLTGSSTSQYAVRRILDAQSIRPIGGFQFLTV
jgi:hypothetical protein